MRAAAAVLTATLTLATAAPAEAAGPAPLRIPDTGIRAADTTGTAHPAPPRIPDTGIRAAATTRTAHPTPRTPDTGIRAAATTGTAHPTPRTPDTGIHTAATAAPAGTARRAPLRILVTDDDGYTAPGIRAVAAALTAAGHDVTIVAPAANNSGVGTKQGYGPAIRAWQAEPKVWAVDGTPGEAVLFGLHQVFGTNPPDLVVSGANFGPNVAAVANHSGTVGAAITALDYGIPAIAVSTDLDLSGDPQPTLRAMPLAAAFTVRLADHLRSRSGRGPLLPAGLGLNVNYPLVGDGSRPARGVELTRQDHQPVFRPAYTPDGAGQWKVTVTIDAAAAPRGTDLHALLADHISIAPITADWDASPSRSTLDLKPPAALRSLAGLTS
ncbi:5'/3'-nucleotidase SurE [Actinoplanes oblitus]|uniref:5'-nucleotidase SurE n=1 Tax=Actinoplanes oblitus TaxID=3040509 RepID=A0ABY8W766_9ACTN|nr:5'/3'-nucleotidase SurE [Actinoplanes oblitus]WIM93337.1 5'/3'-nucleotidase SurE [Actinoplanes oblitus]